MKEDKFFWFIIGFLAGALFAGTIFSKTAIEIRDTLRLEAIEHNCAEYDAKTGEWGWK